MLGGKVSEGMTWGQGEVNRDHEPDVGLLWQVLLNLEFRYPDHSGQSSDCPS